MIKKQLGTTKKRVELSHSTTLPLIGSDVCSSSALRFHLIFRSIGLIIATSAFTIYTIIISKPYVNRE